MAETIRRIRAEKRQRLVTSLFIPEFITFAEWEKEEIMNKLKEEARINFLVEPKPHSSSFLKIMNVAEKRKVIGKALSKEDAEYFSNEKSNDKAFAVRFFLSSLGREKKTLKIMEQCGYVGGSGFQLTQFLLSKKGNLRECVLVAIGSVAKPDGGNDVISPSVIIRPDGAYFSIYDHHMFSLKCPIYFMGVKKS